MLAAGEKIFDDFEGIFENCAILNAILANSCKKVERPYGAKNFLSEEGVTKNLRSNPEGGGGGKRY